jgi:hypothetical protein
MATQDYAASIQGVSIRVTRLDAAGNLLNGAGDSYTTSAFMRVSFTPEYEEGDEITEKNANGVVCVTYKSPDTLKRITMELAICEPDPELSNLISGGLLLRKDVNGVSKSIGWAAPGVGDDPAGFGVAIEAWSHAIRDGKKATTLPYFHWVFPYAKLRQSGDRVIENGMLATTFEGYGLGNPNFASGPDQRWEFPVAAERPYSYARADWAPVGLKGFYTWDSGLVATVSNKALTNNIATLTTSAAHGFTDGDSVVVAGVDATFNGTYTVTDVPTTVTFTYAKTASNVVSAAVSPTGTATVANPINEPAADGSYTAVTSSDLEGVSGLTSDTYNVPGNKDFNPDNTIDRIIVSNEDVSA